MVPRGWMPNLSPLTSTSFPGSFSPRSLWGDEMKDAGNEVALTLRLVGATLKSGKVERRKVIPNP